MKKKTIAMIALCCLFAFDAHAAMQAIEQNIPDARMVGKGRMRVMLWNVYDATLFAPNGQWQGNAPYALKLDYLRHLKGPLIAKRSIEEMEKQGFADKKKLAEWQQKMTAIFPNVQDGDSIIGLRDDSGFTDFYFNDRLIGSIEDPDFTRQFFAIWLDQKTSEPAFRRQLLGEIAQQQESRTP